MTRNLRTFLLVSTAAALGLGGAGLVYAQLEGADRGIPPIDSSSNLEVDGIQVDVGGEDANEARLAGWRIAQRLGGAPFPVTGAAEADRRCHRPNRRPFRKNHRTPGVG